MPIPLPYNFQNLNTSELQDARDSAGDVIGKATPASYLDSNFNQLAQIATVSSTAPTPSYAGQLWLDTSVSPPVLKQWDGSAWQSKVSNADNADKVDNFHASQTPTANTIPVADSTGKLNAGWLPVDGNLNQAQFTSSGNWTVPSKVTKIMVFGIAGGGGGGGNSGNGGSGGNTVISGSVSGTLVSLSGGGGGGSVPGISYSGVAGYTIASYISGDYLYWSGFGSGSPFGGGGRSIHGTVSGEAGNGYGSGGSGAGGFAPGGGGGGSGQCVLGAVYSVSPGETLTVTIGAGGAGGSGGRAGGAGRQGFVRIIYFA